MRPSIDHILDKLAQRTHSPRGRHAASDQTYLSLLDRIPACQRPVVGKHQRQQPAAFTRWSAAACLLLVVGIGLTIAGIWHYHHTPSAADRLPESVPSGMNQASRTLVYEAAPLSDITAELSDVFDTPILIVNPELLDYRITATFSTDESLEEVLAILAEIGNFDVRKTAEGYVIE